MIVVYRNLNYLMTYKGFFFFSFLSLNKLYYSAFNGVLKANGLCFIIANYCNCYFAISRLLGFFSCIALKILFVIITLVKG